MPDLSTHDKYGVPYSTKDALGNTGEAGRVLVGSVSRTEGFRVWINDSQPDKILYDRYGTPFSKKDSRGNVGQPGYMLVGFESVTSEPRIWTIDNAGTDYITPPPVFVSDVVIDTWNENDFRSKPAHEQNLYGYWDVHNRWVDFTYLEALRNQVRPGYFLVRRENPNFIGSAGDELFETSGNGTYATMGRQYHWFPDGVTIYDPITGEYFDQQGVRRINNGDVWVSPNATARGYRLEALQTAVIGSTIVVGGAVAATYAGAAAGAGAAAESGVIVGSVAPAAASTAVPLAAGGAAVAGSGAATAAAGAVVTGSVVDSIISESVDLVTETAADLLVTELITSAMPEPETIYTDAPVDQSAQPYQQQGQPPASNLNNNLLLGGGALSLGLMAFFILR